MQSVKMPVVIFLYLCSLQSIIFVFKSLVYRQPTEDVMYINTRPKNKPKYVSALNKQTHIISIYYYYDVSILYSKTCELV